MKRICTFLPVKKKEEISSLCYMYYGELQEIEKLNLKRTKEICCDWQVRKADFNSDIHLQTFGVSVYSHMAEVPGRVLPAPKLQYGGQVSAACPLVQASRMKLKLLKTSVFQKPPSATAAATPATF